MADPPLTRTTPTRIAPVDPDTVSARTRDTLAATSGLPGDGPLNIFTTLAHNPRTLGNVVALGGGFLFAGSIAARVREIVILRVARNTRSEYEYAQHNVIGQQCDLTADECRALLHPDLPDSFSAFERAVVAGVDELCTDDCVTDATWTSLAAEWDDGQLTEFLVLTGYYRMVAGFLNSAGVRIDPGLEGFPAG
jgi:4-carboxymuconolactone decarboxylase